MSRPASLSPDGDDRDTFSPRIASVLGMSEAAQGQPDDDAIERALRADAAASRERILATAAGELAAGRLPSMRRPPRPRSAHPRRRSGCGRPGSLVASVRSRWRSRTSSTRWRLT
jgi:hypothetical protein